MVYHGYGFGISAVSVISVEVSCALPTVFSATVAARARHGAAQLPSPRDPWLFAVNRAASRCRRCSCPLFGPSATRSLRGADFRGVHAAHPAVMYTSARFFYARQPHKIKRLNPAHCYFGADASVCAESCYRTSVGRVRRELQKITLLIAHETLTDSQK